MAWEEEGGDSRRASGAGALDAQLLHPRLQGGGLDLQHLGGAAEMLEVKPTTLESRMKKLGIERPGS